MINLKENKSYCILPFIHLHVNEKNDIKLCCLGDNKGIKKYTKDLARTIINDFNCLMLVIKPLNAFKGSGIIITQAKDLETNLKNKEGTMLLLNRRGFSTSIRCPACSEVETCKMCQVALTFHQEKNLLLCCILLFNLPF
jgi:hypothetical protein